MNDIIENMPLSLEHAEDGRYIWPARWKMLSKQVYEWKKPSLPSNQENNHGNNSNT